MSTSRTTGELARLIGAELDGPADLVITTIEAIDRSGPGSLTFIRSPEFAARWAGCRADAAVVSRSVTVPDHDAGRRALLIVPDADAALIPVLDAYAPPEAAPEPGVGPGAQIDRSATVDPSASVGPNCAIGPGAWIGSRTVLGPNVTVGAGARIGADCRVHAGAAVLDRCTLGDRCVVHANAVIGSCGFGFHTGAQGPVRIPHIGDVRIEDDVEIGAGTCIDRAKMGSTSIGRGTKIDNLVQIAHNCRIGAGCIICGQTGLSGSVTLGDNVVLAGGVGIADNIEIGAGARIGAGSGVMNNVPAGQAWLGMPAQPAREQASAFVAFRKLGATSRLVKKLERRIARLEDPDAAP